MSEPVFVADLKEKLELYGLSFPNIYAQIEKLADVDNIRFYYITKETRREDKNLILDIFLITNNSVCIGYSLYKDGRTSSAKFTMNSIRSIEFSSKKEYVQMQITQSSDRRMGWFIVDSLENERALREFNLNMFSVWKIE